MKCGCAHVSLLCHSGLDIENNIDLIGVRAVCSH